MGVRKEAFFDLLKRYVRIWRDTWKMRKELDSPKRDKHEREFLPAHLELTETPSAPLPKWTARLIILFALLALIWAWIGQLDIVVVAQGKTEPTGKSKIIQPIETAEVKQIFVTDGQHVSKGDSLLELSVVGGESDISQFAQSLKSAQLSELREQALLDALNKNTLPKIAQQKAIDLAIDDNHFIQAQMLATNQYQAWFAQNQQLNSAIQQHKAELLVTQSQIDRLAETGKIISKQTNDLNQLVQQNFIAKHTYLEQKTKLIDNQKNLKGQKNQFKQIKASITQVKDNQMVNKQNLRRDTLGDISKAREEIEQLKIQLKKAKQRQSLMTLSSPISGKVQQLATHTIGGVVTAAQQVMVIVPSNDLMRIKSLVLNKDIGFISVGQETIIKVEAFPYTRHGYLTGIVKNISLDAIEHEQLGLVYEIVIGMDSDTLNIYNKPVKLSAGMNITAEIKTGRRSVLDYFLSPLQTTVDSSMKQR